MADEVYYNKNVTGFNALIGIEYLNYKYFSLSSNIGFVQKGGKDSITFTGLEINDYKQLVKIMLNYLTINTTINFKVPIKNFIFPYLSIGPRLDYLISYNEDAAFIKQFDEWGKLNKLIYGLVAGAGIDFKINRILIGTVFDYYFNFNKIVDYTSDNNVTNKIIDRTFTVNARIGYRL